MWAMFKGLLSGSKSLNTLLGSVVFSTPREHGNYAHSFLEWRVKKTLDDRSLVIGLSMKPDGYAGAEGSPTNYMNFDLDTAIRLRDHLDRCIEFVREQGKRP